MPADDRSMIFDLLLVGIISGEYVQQHKQEGIDGMHSSRSRDRRDVGI